MKALGIAAIILATLVVSGCGVTERLESELAAANARIQTLDSTLTDLRGSYLLESAQVYNLTQSVDALESRRGELQASLAKAEARVGRLNADMRKARVEFELALDSLRAEYVALEIDRDALKGELDNDRIRIVASERQKNELMRTRDSLYAWVDDVRPWYDYYKHESRRNWLKKLFSADDAARPAGAEPTFATPAPATELEAQRP